MIKQLSQAVGGEQKATVDAVKYEPSTIIVFGLHTGLLLVCGLSHFRCSSGTITDPLLGKQRRRLTG